MQRGAQLDDSARFLARSPPPSTLLLLLLLLQMWKSEVSVLCQVGNTFDTFQDSHGNIVYN